MIPINEILDRVPAHPNIPNESDIETLRTDVFWLALLVRRMRKQLLHMNKNLDMCPDCCGVCWGRPPTGKGIDYSRRRCSECGKIRPEPRWCNECGEIRPEPTEGIGQ